MAQDCSAIALIVFLKKICGALSIFSIREKSWVKNGGGAEPEPFPDGTANQLQHAVV